MNRLLPTLVLVFSASFAHAVDWPWEDDPAMSHSPTYCKGFVVGGLHSMQVQGASRTELWLAWNYLVRAFGPGYVGTADADYQAGVAQFQNVPDAAVAEEMVKRSSGDCGIDRSRLEVTGW